MKISTFHDDLLQLKDFAIRLERFIELEHEFVTGSIVFALSSPFSSGKTTFLDMWKSAIEERADDVAKPLVVSLNAWESDYYGDPLCAIVSSLAEAVDDDSPAADSLIRAVKDVRWMVSFRHACLNDTRGRTANRPLVEACRHHFF